MAARFLSTAQIFLVPFFSLNNFHFYLLLFGLLSCVRFHCVSKVAALSSMIATIYMRIFVKETTGRSDSETLNQPILIDNGAECSKSKSVSQSFKQVLPLKDIFCLLRSRWDFNFSYKIVYLTITMDYYFLFSYGTSISVEIMWKSTRPLTSNFTLKYCLYYFNVKCKPTPIYHLNFILKGIFSLYYFFW